MVNCQTCHADIPEARLRALPNTKHCILCALTPLVKASTQENHLLTLADALRATEEIDYIEGRTTEQAADDRANDLLCRQIERIEGFDET